MSEGSILIVDDEYGVRSGIRTILEMDGYEVAEAGDGAAALEALKERDYDVALLDYRLPDTDGLSLLQTMKQRGCEAMVCMITAYANIDTAIAATRQGVDFFLPKPFSPDDLEGVVATLLRHKRARTEADRLRAEHEASLLALAEEKTQTHSLVSSLRDAVLVVNRDGDIVLANPPMLELLELGDDDVLMRPATELLGGGALAPLGEQLAAPAKDRTVRQLEIGERTWMASIVTFRDQEGEARGRILTLSDISEVRRLAMEKQKFIRMMVHELKSPLGSIKGLLEVVTDKSLGDDLDPYIPMIARADHRIDNLALLIRDLLTLARSEQTQEGEEPELVPVAPVLDEVVELAREHGAQRGVDGDHRPRRGPAARAHPLRRPAARAQQSGRQRRQVQPRRRLGDGPRRGRRRLAASRRGRHRHRHPRREPRPPLGRVLSRDARRDARARGQRPRAVHRETARRARRRPSGGGQRRRRRLDVQRAAPGVTPDGAGGSPHGQSYRPPSPASRRVSSRPADAQLDVERPRQRTQRRERGVGQSTLDAADLALGHVGCARDLCLGLAEGLPAAENC